jgi:HD superfamily phosphodiesterase
MNRINTILQHPLYKDYYQQIQALEANRLYCKHDMNHFLDVARIAYILILEEVSPLPKEQIYAAALLHDIGRHIQYLNKEPHEKASARLCIAILKDSGFHQEEIDPIQEAIANHRNREVIGQKDLSDYLYRADKASRPCYACPQESKCDWDISKKNLSLKL